MSGAFEGLAPIQSPDYIIWPEAKNFHTGHTSSKEMSPLHCSQKHWGQSHGLGDIVASHNEIKGSSWRALGYIVVLSRARILV